MDETAAVEQRKLIAFQKWN